MGLNRLQKHFGDSWCTLQVTWDSCRARQIPGCITNRFNDNSSWWYHRLMTMLLSDKKMRSRIWSKHSWINSNVNTWDAWLRSLLWEGSSSGKRCYCWVTGMILKSKVSRSSTPQQLLGLLSRNLLKAMWFLRLQNRCCIVLVWGRECTWCSICNQTHTTPFEIWWDMKYLTSPLGYSLSASSLQ